MENSKPTEEIVTEKKKILIVEDDEATRAMYVSVLLEKGFQVVEAVDGLEGFDKAIKEKPDLIFTGIMMPKMDGFMMLEALKKNVATSKIPVAISSHMGREEDQKKAVEMGAKDFIPRDYNTPNQVAQRLMAIISSNIYKIKINVEELDAPKLLADLEIKAGLKCERCGGDIVLVLNKGEEMTAKLACAKCGIEA